ncbi:hypothetical protein BGZ60DRAFT_426563 [Tricladium varicosporioides]|nr:hypothetical protein BGZ60DRAFT_426563 [Hymenoscyphus varicosporioides]
MPTTPRSPQEIVPGNSHDMFVNGWTGSQPNIGELMHIRDIFISINEREVSHLGTSRRLTDSGSLSLGDSFWGAAEIPEDGTRMQSHKCSPGQGIAGKTPVLSTAVCIELEIPIPIAAGTCLDGHSTFSNTMSVLGLGHRDFDLGRAHFYEASYTN